MPACGLVSATAVPSLMARVGKGSSRDSLGDHRGELGRRDGSLGSGAEELGRPLETREKHLAEIQELAHLLDDSIRIPIINYRIGLDALVGLVPVVGDFTAFGLASWIIYRAARMGAPKELIAKMVLNSAADTLVGSVPGLGTIVDFVWKSNSRNLRMLERFLAKGS